MCESSRARVAAILRVKVQATISHVHGARVSIHLHLLLGLQSLIRPERQTLRLHMYHLAPGHSLPLKAHEVDDLGT